MEGVDLPVERGGWQPRDRLPDGAGARARRPGKEPAGEPGGVRSGPEGRSPARAGGRRALLACGRDRGAGPLPARAGGVQSRAGPALVAGGVRSAGPAAGCSRATGGRDWRVRERREGIRLEDSRLIFSTRAERLRPPDFDGRAQPASLRYILLRLVPSPTQPLSKQQKNGLNPSGLVPALQPNRRLGFPSVEGREMEGTTDLASRFARLLGQLAVHEVFMKFVAAALIIWSF